MIVNGYKIEPWANLDGADLEWADLRRVNLRGADLRGADLRGADLEDANLELANLKGADLRRVNLYGSNLGGADLRGADIREANLIESDLRRANLDGVNLEGADLEGADLRWANLYNANLENAELPHFQITPKGHTLHGFKKLSNGNIATLRIPAMAERTASLISRKCRAEYVQVVSGTGYDTHTGTLEYKPGKLVFPDKYDPDIRVECTHGIHFFLTPEEAEDY